MSQEEKDLQLAAIYRETRAAESNAAHLRERLERVAAGFDRCAEFVRGVVAEMVVNEDAAKAIESLPDLEQVAADIRELPKARKHVQELREKLRELEG